MNDREFHVRVFIAVLLLSLMSTFGLSVHADSEERRTIRVGYPIQTGLTEVDEKGNYFGYTYEYLMEISQYTGWNYEFVEIEGELEERIVTSMDMLENGEVDILGGMLYNEAMAERFDYAGYSYGTVYTVISTLEEDPSGYEEAMIGDESKRLLRIAVPETAKLRLQELEEYCTMNLITPELIPCKTSEEQYRALVEKKADVLLNVSMNPIPGTCEVAKFAPRPFFFVTTKGNTALSQELASAILTVEQTDPYFESILCEKYFPSKSNLLQMTDAEKEYVENHDVCKVGIYVGKPPYQYIDEETGQVTGISLDLLAYISDKTGLQFEYTLFDSQEALEEAMESQRLDIIAGLGYDYEAARMLGVSMSRPYISTQYVMLINKNFQEGSMEEGRLVLPYTYIPDDGFSGQFEKLSTIADCVRAVNAGEADYTYIDGFSAQYYEGQPEFENLQHIPQTYGHYRICMGVAEPVDKELLGIINKIIVSMPEEDQETIIYMNTIYRHKITLLAVIKDHPLTVIFFVSGIMLAIIGILAWVLHIRTKMSHKVTMELEKHLQFYEMTSEWFFEYNYKTEKIINSTNIQSGTDEILLSDANRKDIIEFIRTKKSGAEDLLLDCADGRQHWMRFVLKTSYNDSGRPIYTMGKVTNVDSEKVEMEHLLDKAQKDSLTHIFNAGTCRTLVEKSLSLCNEEDRGALLFADIDHFKGINDTFGHQEGDRVIIEVANILLESFPKEDIVGRPGGDEFLVYMKDLGTLDELRIKCETLNREIGRIAIGGETQKVTVSIGVSLSDGAQTVDQLYELADKALYQAKAKGRNGYVISSCAS